MCQGKYSRGKSFLPKYPGMFLFEGVNLYQGRTDVQNLTSTI